MTASVLTSSTALRATKLPCGVNNNRRVPNYCRRSLKVVAEQQSSSPTARVSEFVEQLQRTASATVQRYDFASAGLGALAVTTFCVARGQDPATALSITAASTVVALLVNDSLFNDST